MIDTNELRRLAQAAMHPVTKGRWMRLFGERTVYDRMEDGCRGIPVVSTPFSPPHPFEAACLDFIAAANPAVISELLDRLEAAEADALEQARLNGMGSEREAALMAKLEAAEKSDAESLAMYRKARDERDTYKAAYNDCIDKTEWVQEEINRGDLPAKYLGMHRADVIRAEIMRLRDKIEAMERQAPVGEIRDANELGIAQYADIWPCLKAKDKLYALLGAKPPPSVPKGWIQRGMAELEAIRSRQDDDTLLDDRTLIERIGKAMLAAAQEAKP